MPLYITLLRFTQKGMENVKGSPARLEMAKQAFEQHGGTMKGAWYTLGQYDLVVVTEFPSDEHYAKGLLAGASQGFVQGETLRAFTAEEMKRLLG
jgi:uncharacterized protein with GYD domain